MGAPRHQLWTLLHAYGVLPTGTPIEFATLTPYTHRGPGHDLDDGPGDGPGDGAGGGNETGHRTGREAGVSGGRALAGLPGGTWHRTTCYLLTGPSGHSETAHVFTIAVEDLTDALNAAHLCGCCDDDDTHPALTGEITTGHRSSRAGGRSIQVSAVDRVAANWLTLPRLADTVPARERVGRLRTLLTRLERTDLVGATAALFDAVAARESEMRAELDALERSETYRAATARHLAELLVVAATGTDQVADARRRLQPHLIDRDPASNRDLVALARHLLAAETEGNYWADLHGSGAGPQPGAETLTRLIGDHDLTTPAGRHAAWVAADPVLAQPACWAHVSAALNLADVRATSTDPTTATTIALTPLVLILGESGHARTVATDGTLPAAAIHAARKLHHRRHPTTSTPPSTTTGESSGGVAEQRPDEVSIDLIARALLAADLDTSPTS